ncbi:RNA pyrophosphohydrolase [Prochlorococcus marinus str. MIT 1342]|uniref:NUDIX hydrolase n=1 Tax=Prochlorococcus TaxID=1218 RepID=UPI0007B38967|nr:NUDIX hydrolase [Prochlorococcus marinus]KZR79930.1 RNA pyrophosphohydrolase [Prochlorococcus marinus str. MIT 1342]
MKDRNHFLGFRPILQTPFFSLEEANHTAIENASYYRLTGQDSVITCILDQNDQFVMVRQYRPSLEMLTLETPAGGVDDHESPLEAAKREISEETGLSVSILPIRGRYSLMMNRTNIRDYLFFCMFPKEIPGFKKEPELEIIRVERKELLLKSMTGEYMQLAALGLLQVTAGILNVDIWHDSYADIESAFIQCNDVIRNDA